MRAVDAQAGSERGALRTHGEHALDEFDRQVTADAVGEQRELAVLEQKRFLAQREQRREGAEGRSAELEDDL